MVGSANDWLPQRVEESARGLVTGSFVKRERVDTTKPKRVRVCVCLRLTGYALVSARRCYL